MAESPMGQPPYSQPAGHPIVIDTTRRVNPLNDDHVIMAVGVLTQVLKHRLVDNNERFPEPDELLQLWYDAVEGTAIDAMNAPRTGTIAIEDAAVPEGADRAVMLRVESVNGEPVLTSEILTGHHDPHGVAERVRDITRYAEIEDRRGIDADDGQHV